ncbi:BHLH domain-containing protein [Psidium guajava]|nr:BHLH domain-containing protein [Psidium guajava]
MLCGSMFFEDQEFVDPATFGDDLFSILEGLDAEFPLATTTPLPPPPPPPPPLLALDETAVFGSKECDEASSPKNKRQKVMNGGGSCSGYYENQQDGQQQNRMSHITVERNRRKQMNEHLSVLRSLMPCFYVKRGDQASIIGGVADYISELQQVLQSLEAKKQRKAYSEVLISSPRPSSSSVLSPRPSPPVLSPRKPPLSPRPLMNLPISPRTPQPTSPYKPKIMHQSSNYVSATPSPTSSTSPSIENSVLSNSNELVANSKSAIAEVEVKFSGANVLLKTVSPRIPGQALRIVSALEDLSLEILHISIGPVDENTMVNSFTIKVNFFTPPRYIEETSPSC